MSYPALESLFDDVERTPARVCVYMAIRPPYLSHAAPTPIKVAAVAARARVSTSSAGDALAWLIRRGYLFVHSRDRRGMPSVTLAWALPGAANTDDFQNRTA